MKRIAALLLCLLILPGALAETYLIDYHPGYSGYYMPYNLLIRDDGTLIAGEQDYAAIIEITDPDTPEPERRFSAMSLTEQGVYPNSIPAGLCAMIDVDGKQLTGFEYTAIYRDDERGLILYSKPSGVSGVLQPDGTEILEGRYHNLTPLGSGAWAALDNVDDQEEVFTEPLLRIDADGTVTDTGLSGQLILPPDTDGDPLVLAGDGEDLCLDADLKPCMEARFASVSGFEGGRAVAMPLGGTGYGVIDATGAFLLEPEYASISLLTREGDALTLAVDADSRAFTLFDGDMRPIFHMDYRDNPDVADTSIYFDDAGRIAVWLYDKEYNSNYLLYDTQGSPIFQQDKTSSVFDSFNRTDSLPQVVVREFQNGQGGTRCTLVDLEGNRRSDEYQNLSPAVWLDGHGRYTFSIYNTFVGENGYEDVDWNSCRVGVLDENGKELLPSVYLDVNVLGLDRFWVRDGHRSGMIDSAGHWYYALDDYDQLMD